MGVMRTIPFRPKLEGVFRNRFHAVAARFPERDASVETVKRLVAEELAWVEDECAHSLSQRKRYRAIWLLLRDLVQSSWMVGYRAGVVELRLPELTQRRVRPDEIMQEKQQLREWLAESRIERLHEFSPFIESMEKSSSTRKSVLDLVANGTELSERLTSGDARSAVKPYLQLATETARDDVYTNHRLSDIWRYFRFTWSTPPESTPGRTLRYLIRDAAHPHHAVMGIFSLENCAVQIKVRDDYIGWYVDGYIRRMLNGDVETAKIRFEELLRYVKEGIAGIRHDDLCSSKDVEKPSGEVVAVLLNEAKTAEDRRKILLSQDEDDDISAKRSELGRISQETEDALYRKKRAEQLARLLDAKIELSKVNKNKAFADMWRPFIESERGRASVRWVLAAQKSRHIGTSLLELNVCGAVPPYNEILTGKLAALLALSPQVNADYRRIYGARESDIATRLKGKPVVRPAELVYVGTTSLYYVGSSQYNRLKLPPEVLDAEYGIEWKQIGRTIGFGTLHISKATTAALVEATDDEAGFSHINHVFGEGASPKLRLLKRAIRDLLETDQDVAVDLMKHAMRRIVYGAMVARNARAYLLGHDAEPEYFFRTDNANEIASKTEAIVRYWQDRWLAMRMQFAPLSERLHGFSTDSMRVSRNVSEEREWRFSKLVEDTHMPLNEESTSTSNSTGLDYVRNLYRGVSAYADQTDEHALSDIHIETALDAAVLKAIQDGKDVVLTGSPGDGKTHLIRMLLPRLASMDGQHPELELDASCLTEDELFDKWQRARRKKQPFVLAVNAAVLYAVSEEHSKFKPAASAKRQLLHAVTEDETSDVEDENVAVFDLSRRDALAPDTVKSSISKITSDVFYESCTGCRNRAACPVHRHRDLLRLPLFQGRLNDVLTRISLKGEHVTLREVLSFLAFLLFGDRDCRTLNKTAETNDFHLLSLIFGPRGQGRLFDYVRTAFDPAAVCHPMLDEQLLAGRLAADSWVDDRFQSTEDLGSTSVEQIALRKREFFFFNNQGKKYLDISDDETSRFQRFLQQSDKNCVKEVTGLLNEFFGTRRNKTELETWTGFRFDHAPRTILFSTEKIAASRFEVAHPHLAKSMAVGIQTTADHLLFRHRDYRDVALKIDFDMYRLLLAAERGAPMLYIESDTAKRIWRFMERVQGVTVLDTDEVEVTLLEVNEKRIHRVRISREDKRYLSIKQERTAE